MELQCMMGTEGVLIARSTNYYDNPAYSLQIEELSVSASLLLSLNSARQLRDDLDAFLEEAS